MRKTVRVSDMSGKEITDGEGAVIRITFNDARRGAREADLTDQEAQQEASRLNARKVARRGRRPRAAS